MKYCFVTSLSVEMSGDEEQNLDETSLDELRQLPLLFLIFPVLTLTREIGSYLAISNCFFFSLWLKVLKILSNHLEWSYQLLLMYFQSKEDESCLFSLIFCLSLVTLTDSDCLMREEEVKDVEVEVEEEVAEVGEVVV